MTKDRPTRHSLRTLEDVQDATVLGVPADLPKSSYDLLLQTARRCPEAPALSFFLEAGSHDRTARWTYRQLFASVTKTANFLSNLGVGAGDVTALILPNLPETFVAIWAGEAAGIVMPVNPLLEPTSIAALLNTAKAKVLVTLGPSPDSDLYEKAAAVIPLVPSLEHVVLVDLVHYVPGLRRIGAAYLRYRALRKAPPLPVSVKVHKFADGIRQMPGGHLTSPRPIAATDVASYFCTGGTTGLPKIAIRTHGQEISNAWMVTRMLGDALGDDVNLFCGLPLFHVNAVIAVGLSSLLRGDHVVLGTPKGFRGAGVVQRFWEIVSHHKITAFSGVPTLLTSLLDQPMAQFDLSAFRAAISGAAPLSADLLKRFEVTCGVSVIEGYGLTETACVASMNPVEGERRAGSVGLALPNVDIRSVILDGDGAFVRDTLPGEAGALIISGPNVFSGYLSPEHNKRLWVDRVDGRRWLNTGDLGRIDPEGYLWLTGRAKDLIIRGGHNIDPSSIEAALEAHPLVALAAAVGRPDVYAGEVPVAYVQLRSGASIKPEELIRFVAANIGERAAVPKAVIALDQLPLTPIGKIHKPSLRLLELGHAARSALDGAGVAVVSLEALTDTRVGNMVRIVAAVEDTDRIREALSGFTFPHVVIEEETR